MKDVLSACERALLKTSFQYSQGTALRTFTLALGLICWSGIAVAQQDTPSLEEMWQIIQKQQAEIDALKQTNAELVKQLNAPTAAQPELAIAPAAEPAEAESPPEPQPALASAAAAESVAPDSAAESQPEPWNAGTSMEIYGSAMLDMGYANKSSNPDWYDVLRPTKLPASADEHTDKGKFWMGVKQSQLGFRSSTPTRLGDLKTVFEFDLFGLGSDVGRTTFRLRKAWGELGPFGAGQEASVFMDPNVAPNSIEFWGPNGMVFFRNVQVRWTPWQDGDSNFAMALERPGASADEGSYNGRIELEGVEIHLPRPDLTMHYKHAREWGHVQLAGIVRRVEWDDVNDDQFDLSGGITGWGFNLSSKVNLGRHALRGAVVYGKGIENYMNDASVDIGIKNNFDDPVTPVKGVALPVLGITAFLDLNWSKDWSSTIGYSVLRIDNSEAQTPDAFHKGQYALANLLYHPLPNLLLGPEIQWGKRDNYLDGFSSDILRLQFSVKWSFAKALRGF